MATLNITIEPPWPQVTTDDFIKEYGLRNKRPEKCVEVLQEAYWEIIPNFNLEELPVEFDAKYTHFFKRAVFLLAYSKLQEDMKRKQSYKSGDEWDESAADLSIQYGYQSMEFQGKIPGYKFQSGSTSRLI